MNPRTSPRFQAWGLARNACIGFYAGCLIDALIEGPTSFILFTGDRLAVHDLKINVFF